MQTERAIILLHPNAPRPLLHPDPPVTAASVRAAILACNAERQRVTALSGIPLPLVPVPVEGSK